MTKKGGFISTSAFINTRKVKGFLSVINKNDFTSAVFLNFNIKEELFRFCYL